MNIKELKEIIKDLPDEMLVGGSGHYGELLEVYYINLLKVDKTLWGGDKIEILSISMEDGGEEPD